MHSFKYSQITYVRNCPFAVCTHLIDTMRRCFNTHTHTHLESCLDLWWSTPQPLCRLLYITCHRFTHYVWCACSASHVYTVLWFADTWKTQLQQHTSLLTLLTIFFVAAGSNVIDLVRKRWLKKYVCFRDVCVMLVRMYAYIFWITAHLSYIYIYIYIYICIYYNLDCYPSYEHYISMVS